MPEKSLKKNYLYNLSYQILQIIIPIITAPYVSRVLTVEGIGVQSFTHSVASYFLLFGVLSIGLYGQREIAYNRDDDYKKTTLFWELCIIKAITLSLSLCIYFIIIQRFSAYYVFLLIYSVEIFACLFDVTWYYQGSEDFKIIVIRNTVVRIITVGLVFIIIKKPADLYKYILLLSASSLVANISLIPFLLKQLVKIKLKSLNCIRHIKPIIMLFIPQIAIQIYTVLDKSMIGFITQSPYENGCYEQAMKIVRLSITIITSTNAVMIPRMSYYEANKKYDDMKASLLRSFRFVFFLGMPMFLGLFGIADVLVPVFFGSGYDKAIILIKILSVLFLIIGLNVSLGTQYLVPRKKEKALTVIVSTGAAINFMLNMILIKKYQSVGAAASSVIAESIIMIFYFIYSKGTFNIKEIVLHLWRYIAASVIMFLVLNAVKSIMTANIVNLICITLISGIIYFVSLLLLRDRLLLSIISTITAYIEKRSFV
jgi:O-antigen/teichoic acid export membrane protein